MLGSLWFNSFGASAPAGGDAYELISTSIVSGSPASTVTFSSLNTLAASYKHLQLRVTSRDNRNGFMGSQLYMRFNSDTASNYSQHALYGTGSSVGSTYTLTDKMYILDNPGLGGTTSAWAGGVIDILDFSNTNKYKTIRALGGMAQNYNWLTFTSASWRSTAAVDSITFSGLGSQEPGSRFSLYGLKG